MKHLAARAEIAKLAHLLGADPTDYAFLQKLPAAELRELRGAVLELQQRQGMRHVGWMVGIARALPVRFVAWLCEYVFGAMLVALIAGELPARRAVRIASHLSVPYLADACPHLDPRLARDIIQQLPLPRIIAIGLELFRRREYVTIGRFVDFLPDKAIEAILARNDDDEHLLRSAFFVESRRRLDHIVRLLPEERLRRAVLLAIYPEHDVLIEVMSLIVHVSYGLQRELGNLAAEQDDAVLDRVAHAAQAEDLWADILPLLANLAPANQAKLVNLPLLQDEPAVLEKILYTADAEGQWGCVLPLFAFMQPGMKTVVADIAAGMPETAMEHVCMAALTGEYWGLLVEVVGLMPPEKHVLFASVVQEYGRIDPELLARIAGLAEAQGFGGLLKERLLPVEVDNINWVI